MDEETPFFTSKGIDWYENPVSTLGRDTLDKNNDLYRIIGGENKESANFALQDFTNTGAIRGSNAFSGEAYFNHGSPDSSYYSRTFQPKEHLQKLISAFGKDKVIPYNYVIQGNEDFYTPIANGENPLYRAIYSPVNAGKFPSQETKVIGGKYWVVQPKDTSSASYNKHNYSYDEYIPSFFDKTNPANRKGLKITGGYTGKTEIGYPNDKPDISEWVNARSLTDIKPESTIVYDRQTPFLQRPISTHMANANVESKILLSAAKNNPLSLTGLGSQVGLGGAAKGLGLVAGGIITPIQTAQQVNALKEKDLYKREYGASDPMALRPAIDYLRKISGLGYDDEKSQGAGEAWKQQGKLVAEPEWQLQNPISAPAYNLMHGNTEPLKGFVQGYKDMLGIK